MSAADVGGEDEEVITWSNPPCRLMVRSKKQVELYTVPERNHNIPDDLRERIGKKSVLVKGSSASIVRMTSDAAFIMLSGVGVVKCHLDGPEGGEIEQLEPFLQSSSASVQMMDVSPL